MVNIYAVRHGEDEDNASGRLNGRRDIPLTGKGRAQAHATGKMLRGLGVSFDAVYCSPLQRTRQTASEIVEAIGGDASSIVAMPELIERDFGMMTGVAKEEIARLCTDVLRTERVTYFLTGDGVESFPSIITRATWALDNLRAVHPSGNVLLVSHGDFMMGLIAVHWQLPWRDVLTRVSIGNTSVIYLPCNPEVFDEKKLLLC